MLPCEKSDGVRIRCVYQFHHSTIEETSTGKSMPSFLTTTRLRVLYSAQMDKITSCLFIS